MAGYQDWRGISELRVQMIKRRWRQLWWRLIETNSVGSNGARREPKPLVGNVQEGIGTAFPTSYDEEPIQIVNNVETNSICIGVCESVRKICRSHKGVEK